MRINKFLAHCGVDSRRNCESIILDGRITINEEIMTDLSYIVKETDKVKIDGNNLSIPKNNEYYVLHKPKGYISTNKDELGRKNVIELIKTKQRIYSVGRLDKETTGLLIITNDGDFANRILHPKFQIERKYYAYTKEQLTNQHISKIKKGVFLSRKERVKAEIKNVGYEKGKHKYRVILKEGKNREIRRIFNKYNLKVYNLHRYSFGRLTLKGIDRGKYKKISGKELYNILKLK